MNELLRTHADQIVRGAIEAVLPDAVVRRALQSRNFPGKGILVAAGE